MLNFVDRFCMNLHLSGGEMFHCFPVDLFIARLLRQRYCIKISKICLNKNVRIICKLKETKMLNDRQQK